MSCYINNKKYFYVLGAVCRTVCISGTLSGKCPANCPKDVPGATLLGQLFDGVLYHQVTRIGHLFIGQKNQGKDTIGLKLKMVMRAQSLML